MTVVVPAKRSGPGHWWHGLRTMFRWELTRMRLLLPITILVQFFTGAGLVLGIGLFFEQLAPETVLYLATGAVVISLVTVGLVLGPQLVAQQRLAGSADYIASFPVPRSSALVAWIGLNLMIAIPGMVGAVLVAQWRYGAEFSVSWLLVPGTLLTLTAGALIGYAYAYALPEPQMIGVISQVLIFVIFGFSPISYPAENLPDWLAQLHQFLPFVHMGDVVRAGLTTGIVTSVGLSFVVLAIWTGAAGVVAAMAVGRRS